MCNDRSSFIAFKKLRLPARIKLGDDSVLIATYHGLISLAGTGGHELDVVYTPTFRFSLLSISRL